MSSALISSFFTVVIYSFLFSQTVTLAASKAGTPSAEAASAVTAATTAAGGAPTELYTPDSFQDDGQLYDELFQLAYRVQMDKDLYKKMNTAFADYMVIPDYMRKKYNLPEKATSLTTTQLILILKSSPQIKEVMTKYIGAAADAKAGESIDAVSDQIQVLLKDEKLTERLKRLTDPSQPLALIPQNGGAGYTDIQTYINHPYLEDPNNPNSKERTHDNLVSKWLEFIDGVKQELWINSFEFSHPEIAEAVLRALARGVKTHVGIDKNTLEHRQNNKDVWALFSAAKDPKKEVSADLKEKYGKLLDEIKSKKPEFVLTDVDPEKINHQKIAARDPGTPNAGVLISSGNLTPSCMDCRGSAYGEPDLDSLKGSIPNANHLTVIKSNMLALIVRNELRKTIVDKLKGRNQYPVSGSYIVYGEKLPGMDKPPYWMITFSPNGGLGNIVRDVLMRIIVGTTGPIIGAEYAFTSPDALDGLIERFKKEKAAGRPVDFSFVGEANFMMQPYSTALHLAGFKLNGKVYEDDPDAKIHTVLNESELKAFREKIFLPPAGYADSYIPMADGKKFKETAVMHHKLILVPQSHISTSSTSFNVSESAEGNQEQINITNDPRVFSILHGGVMYLMKHATHSIATEVTLRNARENGKEASGEHPSKSAKEGSGTGDGEASADCALNLAKASAAASTAAKAAGLKAKTAKPKAVAPANAVTAPRAKTVSVKTLTSKKKIVKTNAA